MNYKVVCIGAALVDELYFCKEPVIIGTSNPATVNKFVGGVMSNISQHLSLLDIEAHYITVFGNDSEAGWMIQHLNKKHISTKDSKFIEGSSGKYTSIQDKDGSLFTAVCVDICEKHLTPEHFESKEELLLSAELILTDTNIPTETIVWLISFCRKHHKKLIIEPVSVVKARKLINLDLSGVFMMTPNEDEAKSICNSNSDDTDSLGKHLIDKGVENVWIRCGSRGSTLYTRDQKTTVAVPKINVIDSTGAGDSALAAWVFAYVQKYSLQKSIETAHSLAFEVLQQKGAVCESLNIEMLIDRTNYYYHE
jgi:pseudouridine kinase